MTTSAYSNIVIRALNDNEQNKIYVRYHVWKLSLQIRKQADDMLMSWPLPVLRLAERTCRVPADIADRLDELPPAAAAADDDDDDNDVDEGCEPMMRRSMLNSRDLLLSSTTTWRSSVQLFRSLYN